MALGEIREKDVIKVCPICGKELPLRDFYENIENKQGFNHDFWCKNCAKRFVQDKDTMKEYCENNARVFMQDLWEDSKELAKKKYVQKGGAITGDSALSEAVKQSLIRSSISSYFRRFNSDKWYRYNDPMEIPETIEEYEEKADVLDDKAEAKVYSHEWRGYYTPKELADREEYMNNLRSQFEITDSHIEDNFRQVVNASLNLSKANEEYNEAPTKENMAIVKQASDVYRTLSDSAKLSASKRTAVDQSNYSDLGSIIAEVEQGGFLINKPEFEKDDVDMTIDMIYEGIALSVGGDV